MAMLRVMSIFHIIIVMINTMLRLTGKMIIQDIGSNTTGTTIIPLSTETVATIAMTATIITMTLTAEVIINSLSVNKRYPCEKIINGYQGN